MSLFWLSGFLCGATIFQIGSSVGAVSAVTTRLYEDQHNIRTACAARIANQAKIRPRRSGSWNGKHTVAKCSMAGQSSWRMQALTRLVAAGSAEAGRLTV